jgi:hypothetical protein
MLYDIQDKTDLKQARSALANIAEVTKHLALHFLVTL